MRSNAISKGPKNIYRDNFRFFIVFANYIRFFLKISFKLLLHRTNYHYNYKMHCFMVIGFKIKFKGVIQYILTSKIINLLHLK